MRYRSCQGVIQARMGPWISSCEKRKKPKRRETILSLAATHEGHRGEKNGGGGWGVSEKSRFKQSGRDITTSLAF